MSSQAGPGGERAAPFYCPYCAEEQLRSLDAGPGRFVCTACRRAFALTFMGIGGAGPDPGPRSP